MWAMVGQIPKRLKQDDLVFSGKLPVIKKEILNTLEMDHTEVDVHIVSDVHISYPWLLEELGELRSLWQDTIDVPPGRRIEDMRIVE
ncbi:hypothetical protein RJT34_16471 [Clitoria ternatea]|uniref:Uncharacterized protein n=1 Tax=Clitoria ternatea TaxID=43366 RepID=A0AAN9PCW4_CLITE